MQRWLVKDVMTEDVVAVGEDMAYKEIVETLADRGISAAPVVDRDRHVLGVVSEADLLPRMEFAGAEPQRRILERKSRRTAKAKAAADTARGLMSGPAVVTSPIASITTAAKVMDAERVKRLPVVDEDGRLVGVVSRSDLLRVYLRDDAAIRDDIVNRVLVHTMWIEPGTIDVAVRDGQVTLDGTVDRSSTKAIVVRLVEGVDGVVDVADNLNYSYDDRPDQRQRYPTAADVLP